MFKKILKKVLPKKDTKELESLHEIPKAEKGGNMPRFTDYEPHFTNQADLLYLPSDRGYKYALVVVDNATRKLDAVPLRKKTPSSIVKGFKKIYDRDILKQPKAIEVDDGNEFKGETKEYFKVKHIRARYANVNRHRQQALVEKKNHILGKAIFLIQNQKELETGKTNREWVKDLKDIIETINDHIEETRGYKDLKPKHKYPISTRENKNLLPIGTQVRVSLDYPEDIATGKRLGGNKFRAGDIRNSRKIYEITEIFLKPDKPPMYGVNDGTTVQRTKQQLQPV